MALGIWPSSTSRSEEHTSELQSHSDLVCRLLLEPYAPPHDLHSFPTRRSSDLAADASAFYDAMVAAVQNRKFTAWQLMCIVGAQHDANYKWSLPTKAIKVRDDGTRYLAVKHKQIGRAHV